MSYGFSVVVKEDRKLLTVLFPDSRDGRTFTLKVGSTPVSILNILLSAFAGSTYCCP